ncbi:hypothetical protein [Noviherbaspirillum autotrophicum]|uniref:hypothetical protein n=1 Tax=Noviherbaspirillum autotrophicum TaxID=709839 RepID=UPI0012FD69C5|nr:hypothetical protein [Noviherbaspirillum autotrophicum]
MAVTAATISVAAHADDIISRFTVRDAGQFAVDAVIAGTVNRNSIISTSGQGLIGEERDHLTSAAIGGNIGLGSGFEARLFVPYVRNRYDVDLSTPVPDKFSNKKEQWGDALISLKYRAFRSANGSDEMQINGSVLHHSGNSGYIAVELDYLHSFNDDLSIAVAPRYTKRQGLAPNEVGLGAYLMSKLTPKIHVVPFLYLTRIRSHGFTLPDVPNIGDVSNVNFSASSVFEVGLEMRCSPAKSWNLTPRLVAFHQTPIDSSSSNVNGWGAKNGVSASLTLQKEF